MARNNSSARSDDDQVRAKVLAGAEKTILHFGLAKTTMDDIAKASGVSRPTIYRTFGDRDTLVAELIGRRAHAVNDRARSYILKRKTFRDQLIDGLTFLISNGAADPIIQTLVSPEHMDWASELLNASMLARDLTVELWGPIFEAAQERGEMRRDLNVLEACEWLAALEFVFVGRPDLRNPDDHSHRALIEEFVVPAFIV